nr:UPF0462 protein C4orf33 homolog isoform X2 [Camelus dromedarius]
MESLPRVTGSPSTGVFASTLEPLPRTRGQRGGARAGPSAGTSAKGAHECWTESLRMDFKIEHTWDEFPVKHEPVFVRVNPGDGGVMMEISAPFFNDPPAPLGEPGKPFNELWDYEVVEAFFLNDITEQYLEVELCPHGQHLVLLLSGRRNVWKQELDLSFKVSRGETKWEGKAYLPWSYFPPNVTKFNSFAIHGSKDKRNYEALYPVPQHELQQGQKPDLEESQILSWGNLRLLLYSIVVKWPR